jgi:hypothetical protein
LKGKIKTTYVIVVEENKKQLMVSFGNIKNNIYQKKMSRLSELISKTLKELKVKKKVDESYWEREPDENGWDVINYYTDSNDNKKTRERIEKINVTNQKKENEKQKPQKN